MNLDEKIEVILNELKFDSRTAYRVLLEAKKEIDTLRGEVERLKPFEAAIYTIEISRDFK